MSEPRDFRAGPRVRNRLDGIQAQLLTARNTSRLSQEKLAETLGVTSRSLRDWEKRYDRPSVPHLIDWARILGFRLALLEWESRPVLEPVTLEYWETLINHEVRRLAAPLKAQRKKRRLSQTDMAVLLGVTRSTLQRWEDGQKAPVALALTAWSDRLGYTLGLLPFRG